MAELIVGIGLQPGARAEDILAAVAETFGDTTFEAFATVDVRGNDIGLRYAANALGVRIDTFTAVELAAVDVPHPGAAAKEHLGTPSVAEAAAILASGGAPLVQQKTVANGIVLAAARVQDPVP